MMPALALLDPDGTAHLSKPYYFSRARLKTAPEIATLVPLLVAGNGQDPSADHRLVWHIFAAESPEQRSFLFRREPHDGMEGPPRFLILSQTQPPEETALFDIETQAFDPRLKAGDTLRFSLVANPTVALSADTGHQRARSRIVDVVMAAIHASDGATRADGRRKAIVTAGTDWLAAQGNRNGFELVEPAETLRIDGYQTYRLARTSKGKGSTMTYATLEFEGLLRITNPQAFVIRLAQGFGRAKAFGCGLMLIRRA